MKIGSLVMAGLLTAALLAAVLPGQATTQTARLDKDHPNYRPVEISEGLQNPTWWGTPSGPEGMMDDRPVWVQVHRPIAPFRVTLSASGPVVGQMHVYEFYPTFDRTTPPCPQAHISRLYWQLDDGEPAFSYLVRLNTMLTQEHQVALPSAANVDNSVSIEIVPRGQSYVFVFDALAGTANPEVEGVAGEASLDYSIASLDESIRFLFLYPTVNPNNAPPGFDVSTWSGNSGKCIDEGPPVPPGIPPEDVPQTGAPPELPGLGPSTLPLDRLFGTSL